MYMNTFQINMGTWNSNFKCISKSYIIRAPAALALTSGDLSPRRPTRAGTAFTSTALFFPSNGALYQNREIHTNLYQNVVWMATFYKTMGHQLLNLYCKEVETLLINKAATTANIGDTKKQTNGLCLNLRNIWYVIIPNVLLKLWSFILTNLSAVQLFVLSWH